MNRYRVTVLMFALAAVFFLVYPQHFSKGSAATAQKRTQRRVTVQKAAGKPRVDYSHFSHYTSKHQGACNTCHKAPTDNWKKARGFPDVADYPGHDACVGCHRPQFFKGASPVICSVCHSKVSPRDDVRFAFRNPAAPRQFTIEFPHDKHQDVIARKFPSHQTEERPLFLRASFTKTEFSPEEKAKHYNNCEICHSPRTNPPVTPAAGWPDAFVPDAATFKAVPMSHASCFNCHWKSEQPTRENCGGCHKSLSTNVSWLVSANPKATPTGPVVLLGSSRISLKFRHARERHVDECTTCHINITKAATLRALKPDVPITSCAPCHQKDGLRQDVGKELQAIDKNRDFVCSYCHTSDVGRRDPPFGHYLMAGRQPMQRKDVK